MNNEELLLKLRKERMELTGKINKLVEFRGSVEWNNLSVNHKQLLDIQLKAMETYREALIGRCLDIEEKLNDKSEENKEENDENPVKVIIIIDLGEIEKD